MGNGSSGEPLRLCTNRISITADGCVHPGRAEVSSTGSTKEASGVDPCREMLIPNHKSLPDKLKAE